MMPKPLPQPHHLTPAFVRPYKMNTPLIRKYQNRSYREVYWKLHDEGMPESLIEETLQRLRSDRAEQRKQRLAYRASVTAWREVLASLQHERRIVRSMAKYKTATPAPERDEFVQAYAQALTTVYDRLCALSKKGGMPEHTHWTDYVPEKVKDAFARAIREIPPRANAKIKQPFERTDPYALHDKRKGRLLRRTKSELKTAEERQDFDKVEKIKDALEQIKRLPANAHLPNTWHAMLKQPNPVGHAVPPQQGESDEEF